MVVRREGAHAHEPNVFKQYIIKRNDDPSEISKEGRTYFSGDLLNDGTVRRMKIEASVKREKSGKSRKEIRPSQYAKINRAP